MAIRKIVSRSIGVDVIAAEDLANNSVTAAEIQDGVIGLNKLSATGTKDATTFLRGDNSFQVVTTPTLSSLGIDNHDDVTVDASGHVAIGTTTQNGASLVIDNGTVQSPAASGNMNTGVQIQAGTGSQALNIGNDGDGTWYNSAYANNSGVPRNHRFLVGQSIEALKIDTTGVIHMDKQPRFEAYATTSGWGWNNSNLPFNATKYDNYGTYNTSTYAYTIPTGAGGLWQFGVRAMNQAGFGQYFWYIKINGSNDSYIWTTAGQSQYDGNIGVRTVQLSAGDTVAISGSGSHSGMYSSYYDNSWYGIKLQ